MVEKKKEVKKAVPAKSEKNKEVKGKKEEKEIKGKEVKKEVKKEEHKAKQTKEVKTETKKEEAKTHAKQEKKSEEELDKLKMEKLGELRLYEVIEYPLITEKAVNLIESENKMTFVVNKKATRADVKKAIESIYSVKVDKVNILKDMKSRKRALVKINKQFKADNIATSLGVL